MPANSVDTFFACSLFVIIVVSAMAAMPKVMNPFMDGLAHRNSEERLQQLAQYILLSTGEPADWGSNHYVSPTGFGLADATAQTSYVLDADKVTRLNSENRYALTYAQLLDALKVSNIALRISVQPIFNTSISLISSTDNGTTTSYNFEITTQKSGLAVASYLSGYFVVGNYVGSVASSTEPNGKGTVSFTVSNGLNGSALLMIFAQAQANPGIVSFGVYSFAHNDSVPEPKGTFALLHPLAYVLSASLNYPNEQVLGAYAFSYGYWANMTLLSEATQTVEYSFPGFLNKSATILVLTGLNETTSFAEWVAYPQVPLDVGVNFDSSHSRGSVSSFTHVVTINNALYELQIECKEVN